MRRLTVPAIRNAKGKDPIVVLTAYTIRMAQILDGKVVAQKVQQRALRRGDPVESFVHGQLHGREIAVTTGRCQSRREHALLKTRRRDNLLLPPRHTDSPRGQADAVRDHRGVQGYQGQVVR